MASKKSLADRPISRFPFIPKGFIMSSGRVLLHAVAAPAVVLAVALLTVGLVKTDMELIRD